MRTLILLLAMQSATTGVEIDKQALIGRMLNVIQRDMDMRRVARQSGCEVGRKLQLEKAETVSESAAGSGAVGSRLEQLFYTQYRSREFLERTLGTWLDRKFTAQELEQILKFAETPTGRKAMSEFLRLGDELTDLAMRDLWGEVLAITRPNYGGSPDGPRPPPPPPAPGGPLRVGGAVRAPVVISRVDPQYTDEARAARIQGIVIVEALIDETGIVRDIRVLKGLPGGLDLAAIEAVKQWRFRPATLEGKPVAVVFNLTVNFRLKDQQPPS